MGRGRSVYKQPGTRVDEDRTTQRGGIPSKYEGLRERGVVKGNQQGELARGIHKGLHHDLVSSICVYVS
jgi:hypothetical protein